MNTKLTLSLDKDVIEQARQYAHAKQQSLSLLVENYFRFLIHKRDSVKASEISATVQELSGIINLDSKDDIREEYTDYLLEKYN
ncbi:conserved hypothetical protein [Desulfamplus magnetovallimortis]|uniref:Antitoxin n=1 Tax=Desulfamplus magnetovallimortis TaxID=1246637 RepID=A0A1W1HA89_9BACT|nr:DUF6364 family protein [Desulfamplus magnetovallimortis]SLM29353.1 conserved hypothetical protein [Desulfamplus magnetovallimortis]